MMIRLMPGKHHTPRNAACAAVTVNWQILLRAHDVVWLELVLAGHFGHGGGARRRRADAGPPPSRNCRGRRAERRGGGPHVPAPQLFDFLRCPPRHFGLVAGLTAAVRFSFCCAGVRGEGAAGGWRGAAAKMLSGFPEWRTVFFGVNR